ncbi:unnamed protein product [Peronospora destructor]|uniref:Ankyrin repeat-containing domain n=1 Tax=Peronospora destructor TaxID=86335 RepID=A0AAV0V474_9STRA|nr:unnamed protein product [Peronospora destructor]
MMERMMSVEVVVRDQVDPIARELVPELIESFLDFTTLWTLQKAACSGYLSLLKRLGERNAEFTEHGMDWSLQTAASEGGAAAGGHIDVVQWLHKNRTEGCTTEAIDTAAAGGHLATFQWLWSNRTEGCTTAAIDFAIFNGHFAVVK